MKRLLGLLLPLLAASCVLPPAAQPVTAQTEHERYTRLAQRYEADKQGGMAAVVADVMQCYQAATYPTVAIMPLRDCLILDGEGAREDKVASRAFGMSLPYYTQQMKVQRWGHYGKLAGFSDPRVLVQYIDDGSSEIQFYRQGGQITH